ASDLEIAEQRDSDRPVFIIFSASVGRYLLLRTTEYRALRLLDGKLTPAEVCNEFMRRHGGTLRLTTLTKFLTRLDEIGALAGERAGGHQLPERQLSAQFYTRFKLFNPDLLFTRMVAVFSWVWTTPFFAVSLLVMFIASLLALMNAAEIAHYVGYILREHYVAVIVAGLLVGVTHEFAHGLTCKAFGGRATEVGVLMLYYFLPALYCNVSGIHLIPQRGRRLWVIAAGVYWQLLVAALALLLWLALAPYTLLADLAFGFFCGSALDVTFNGNPLIKLDGYYYLSQWLRLPNLMERSRDWWRGSLRRIVFGETNETAAQFSRREQAIFAAFGLLSFIYTLALRFFIVTFLGAYLTGWFYLPGLLCAIALALFYARRSLRWLIAAIFAELRTMSADFHRFFFTRMKENMTTQDQSIQASSSSASGDIDSGRKTAQDAGQGTSRLRRRLVPLAIAAFVAMILCLPWNASVGAYGALTALSEEEAIIRAPESATLIELRVRPGDLTAAGAVIGRMGDLELEEELAQTQAEIARANADYNRLLGELKAGEESIVRAEANLRQRQRDYDESYSERRQIEERERAEPKNHLTASIAPVDGPATSPAAAFPASIAVLQSDADLRQARLSEAGLHLDRIRRLHAQGIAPRSELDRAETNAGTLAIELNAALRRLEAALVEHRRRHASLATEAQLAHSDVVTGRLQSGKLEGELRSARALISTLTERRDLLRRRLAQFELITPRPGAVFGAELPRMVGQYFPKGAEICRVADTRRLLARIQASEREIGDVRAGHPVRLKVSAYPDHVFRGKVVNVGGESETDQNGRVIYRVELVIENTDELLRPGMTAFARIDVGRRMIGAILLRKIKQSLRPELWMI
ncbi:MAG TPA: HlyD family efflux transporter periplasmic adaptor subunit, partial [Blastocatellia bacterium]|nr:HlyD family efflux transporter periplasmic adaptor subunit [Blastocatellia bacterium]